MSHFRPFLVSLVLATPAVLTACHPDDSSSGPAPVLATSKSLTTLKQGQSTDIKVSARDASLQNVAFSVTSNSNCFEVSSSADTVTVKAGTATCSDDLTLNAPSIQLSKTVHVNVVDPLSMDIGDGLLIRYANSYQWRWNDSGSGADHDMAFWHPVAPAGYYALGSVIRGNYEDLNVTKNVPTLVVKDSKNSGALAAPTGYELIWGDWGSGASNDGSVWRPICPAGYVALGVVTQSGYGAPSIDDVRCVKDRYTVAGALGGEISNDSGSGADHDVSVWDITVPAALAGNDGRVPFPVGTSLACPGYDAQVSCASQMGAAHVLMLPLPVTEQTDNADVEPRLTGYQPLDVSIPRFFSSTVMPFTLIPAAATTNVDFNVNQSPFYSVYRTESYTTLPDGVIDNRQGSNTVRKVFQVQTGLSDTETKKFSQQIGITVTAEGEAGFLGSGGKWSVALSTQLGWEQSHSSTYSTVSTTQTEFTIPAGAYAQVVQVKTQFIAVDAFGTALPAQINGDSSIVKYLEYKPK